MRKTEIPIFEFEHIHFIANKHFTFVAGSHRFRFVHETMHMLDEKQFNFTNDSLREITVKNKLFPDIRPRTQMSRSYRDDCLQK